TVKTLAPSVVRFIVKQLVIVVPDHRSARAGRGNNEISLLALEDLDEMLSHGSGIRSVTGVERRLAAAGLRLVECHLDTKTAQCRYHRFADARKHLINKAGYEQGDSHSVSLLYNVISQGAELLNGYFVDVAGLQEHRRLAKDTDSIRCSSRNHIARL